MVAALTRTCTGIGARAWRNSNISLLFVVGLLILAPNVARAQAQTEESAISVSTSTASSISAPSDPSGLSGLSSVSSLSEISTSTEDSEDSPSSISLDELNTSATEGATTDTADTVAANTFFTSGTAPSLVSKQDVLFLSENTVTNDPANKGKANGKTKNGGKTKGRGGGGWKTGSAFINDYLLMNCQDLTEIYNDLTATTGTGTGTGTGTAPTQLLRGQSRKKIKGIERSYCLQDCPSQLIAATPAITPIFACEAYMHSSDSLASRCVKLRKKHDGLQTKLGKIRAKPQRIQDKRGVMRRYQRYEGQVESILGQLDAFCSAVPSS